MIVLGLDPGTTRIGYGVVEKGAPPELLACGVLNVKAKNREARLSEAVHHLKKLLKIYKPEVVALEKLFFVKNRKTGLQVSEMRGALLVVAYEENKRLLEYAPTEIKLYVTGDGKADKSAVSKMVKLTLQTNKIPGPDDVTDAIAVALAALYDIRNHANFT